MTKIFEEKVLEKLEKLEGKIDGLEFEIGSLRGLKDDVRRLEVLHEETDSKIDAIIEGVSPTIEKVNDHELRLTHLEAKA